MPDEKLPIRMLHDRVLVKLDTEAGERRSSGGIVIPATAALGSRRLAWCSVVAVGAHVRAVEVGDRVLFDPEDKAEVEVQGEAYVACGSGTSTPWPPSGSATPRPVSTSDPEVSGHTQVGEDDENFSLSSAVFAHL